MSTPSSIVHRLLEDISPNAPSKIELCTLALRFAKRVQHLSSNPRSAQALATLEKFVNGAASEEETDVIGRRVRAEADSAGQDADGLDVYADMAIASAAMVHRRHNAVEAAYYARKASDDPEAELLAQQQIVDEMNVIFDLK